MDIAAATTKATNTHTHTHTLQHKTTLNLAALSHNIKSQGDCITVC